MIINCILISIYFNLDIISFCFLFCIFVKSSRQSKFYFSVARVGVSWSKHLRGQSERMLRGICDLQFHDVLVGILECRSPTGTPIRNVATNSPHVSILLLTRLGNGKGIRTHVQTWYFAIHCCTTYHNFDIIVRSDKNHFFFQKNVMKWRIQNWYQIFILVYAN